MTIQEDAFELQLHLQLNTVYVENYFQKYFKHILDFKKDNLHHGSVESKDEKPYIESQKRFPNA